MYPDLTIDTKCIDHTCFSDMKHMYHVYKSTETEFKPTSIPITLNEYVTLNNNVSKYRAMYHWVARIQTGDIVGYSELKFKKVKENSRSARFDVRVLLNYRRKRIASKLVECLLGKAIAEGRTLFTCTSIENDIPAFFLRSLGGKKKSIVQESYLSLSGVDSSILTKYGDYGDSYGNNYLLLYWNGVCPSEYLSKLTKAKNLMNAMPRDMRRKENWTITSNWLVEEELMRKAAGIRWWTFIVLHKPDDNIVGFGELHLSPDRPFLASIEEMAIKQTHRNMGLGKWLKANMFKILMEKETGVRNIRTINSIGNKPILKINDSLGFRPMYFYGKWELDSDSMMRFVKDSLKCNRQDMV